MTRPRGVTCIVMPEEVAGPFSGYALIVRANAARMVHTEGVAYLVTDEKPWCWNDHDPAVKRWTLDELRQLRGPVVDLADWVREYNARLEDNFSQVYAWAERERCLHPGLFSTGAPHPSWGRAPYDEWLVSTVRCDSCGADVRQCDL